MGSTGHLPAYYRLARDGAGRVWGSPLGGPLGQSSEGVLWEGPPPISGQPIHNLAHQKRCVRNLLCALLCAGANSTLKYNTPYHTTPRHTTPYHHPTTPHHTTPGVRGGISRVHLFLASLYTIGQKNDRRGNSCVSLKDSGLEDWAGGLPRTGVLWESPLGGPPGESSGGVFSGSPLKHPPNTQGHADYDFR